MCALTIGGALLWESFTPDLISDGCHFVRLRRTTLADARQQGVRE
jgi:hypothetical protein